MDETRTTLAAELAAELEVSLPATARALAAKLRQSEALRGSLAQLGLVRPLKIPDHDTTERDIVGVSASAVSMPALGGLLYGISTHAHRLRVAQRTILTASEQVRVHMGDLDFYESGQRLRWKAGQCLFELLGEILSGSEPPSVVLLDLPIFVSRGEERNRELIEEVQEEWLEMVDTINGFWRAHLAKLLPLRPGGVMVASVQSQNALPLFVALNNNAHTSPDEVTLDLPDFIRTEWTRLRQSGMSRLVDMLLRPRSRTIAYALEDLHPDPRWQPDELHHSGILAFFMRAGEQTPIWQIQVAGHRTQWTSEMLDELARAVAQVTLGAGRDAEPLPLWYARRLATFPKAALAVLRDVAAQHVAQDDANVTPEG